MRRIAWLACLALLALPLTAFADSTVTWEENEKGTINASTAGLTGSGSHLTFIDFLNGNTIGTGAIGTNVGTVSFSLGAFTGSLATGGTFSATNSTFEIVANKNTGNGYSKGAVMFSGTFTQDAIWTETITGTGKNTTYGYTLTGPVTGTFYDANGNALSTINSKEVQTTILLKKPYAGGVIGISTGSGTVSIVPEPGTLGLLGTGLVCVGGLIRRKIQARG